MLAVAAQLPAAVLADEASGAIAIATIAQITEAALFVLTMRPPLLASMNEASIGSKTLRLPYKTLKRWRTGVRPRWSITWRQSSSNPAVLMGCSTNRARRALYREARPAEGDVRALSGSVTPV
jgi:hypothetical protein